MQSITSIERQHSNIVPQLSELVNFDVPQIDWDYNDNSEVYTEQDFEAKAEGFIFMFDLYAYRETTLTAATYDSPAEIDSEHIDITIEDFKALNERYEEVQITPQQEQMLIDLIKVQLR